jgi:hypothetical protein
MENYGVQEVTFNRTIKKGNLPKQVTFTCDYCKGPLPIKTHIAVSGPNLEYSWACSHNCAELLIMQASNPTEE